MSNDTIMDRAAKRLERLHNVTGWLLDHWGEFPDNLYEQVKNSKGDIEYIPYDIREFLFELAQHDLANTITPAINWRVFTKDEGIKVEPKDNS